VASLRLGGRPAARPPSCPHGRPGWSFARPDWVPPVTR